MDLHLKGKTAIITGGTKGIGAGIARALAAEGVDLALVYRSRPEESNAFAASLSSEFSIRAAAFCADVSDAAAVDALYASLLDVFPHPDILINNAAGGTPEGVPFDELSVEQWDLAMDGCLRPLFLMTKPFVVACKKDHREGHIVNVSAKVAFASTSRNKIPYATAKGAIATMTKRLANDYIEDGIWVNAIVPGYVLTSYYNDPESPRCKAKEKDLRIGWATPEDMGNVAAFLCSDRSRQIVGAIVDCSGGTML